MFITNITTVNPTNPMRKNDGSPFSFSGMISRTIVYRMTPEMNENKI